MLLVTHKHKYTHLFDVPHEHGVKFIENILRFFFFFSIYIRLFCICNAHP